MTITTDHLSPPGASEQALAALNGDSVGSTALWDYQPQDYLRGEITYRQSYLDRLRRISLERLEILIEEGTEGGRPLTHHAHRVLLANHSELQRLIERLDPRAGDTLTICYLGRDDTRRPSRHLFRYAVEQADQHLSPATAYDDDRGF